MQDASRTLTEPVGSTPSVNPVMNETPRSKIVRRMLVVIVIVTTVMSWVATALTPILATRYPALLLMLESAGRNLLLTRKLPLFPYLLIATVRRVGGAALFYLLGRWYGEVALQWLERKAGSKSS